MATKDIDPFDRMENENDRMIFIIRQIIACGIVVAGLIYIYWIWFVAK